MKYLHLIRILKGEIDNLCRHFGDDARYASFLKILSECSDYGHPTQKELIQRLKLHRPALMKFLNELYSDFLSAISEPDTYQVSRTEITLIVKTKDRAYDIGVKGLQQIPNVGDEFRVYFIDAFCKVTKVNHYLDRGIHEIHIYLEELPTEYLISNTFSA